MFPGGYTWAILSSTGGRDRPAITFDVSGVLHVVAGKTGIGVEGYDLGGYPADSWQSSLSFTSITSWIKTLPGLSSYPVPTALGLRSNILPIPPVSSSSSTAGPNNGGSNSSNSSSPSIGTGAIIGIVIGGFFGLLLIAFIICFFCCGTAFRSKKSKKRSSTGEQSDEAHIGAPGDSHHDGDTAHERDVEMTEANK